MRTTLELDKASLRGAMNVSSNKTKTAVINEALRDYAKRRSLRKLLTLAGALPWEGDLDHLRKRKSA